MAKKRQAKTRKSRPRKLSRKKAKAGKSGRKAGPKRKGRKSVSSRKLKMPFKVPSLRMPSVKQLSSIKKLPEIKMPRLSMPKLEKHEEHLWLSVKPGEQAESPGPEEAEAKPESGSRTIQKFMKPGPAKRCQKCGQSLAGLGGFFSGLAGVKRSKNDPNYCSKCG